MKVRALYHWSLSKDTSRRIPGGTGAIFEHS